MNVVITADSYLPRLGGQEIGAFRLAKYLRRKGHGVRIFTTEKHLFAGPEKGGLEVIRAPHRFDPSARRGHRAVLEGLFRDTDVVHARYCYRLAALSAPVARRLGRRFVVSLHGLGLRDNPGDSPLKRWSHGRYRRRSLTMADAVIATSTEFAKLASTYVDPSRIHVIPNGVDSDEFDAALPVPRDLAERYAGSRVILAVCRLIPSKGIQYLVQSAPLVLKSCPDARFVVGGWGPMENDLKRQAHELGVETRFDFVGPIQNQDVPGYLALACVVAFPSTAESTSHACLEAMAMGRPVVASHIKGLEELLGTDGRRGVLVKLFDSTDYCFDAPPRLPAPSAARLAGAMIGLLEDPARARAVGEAGRAHALAAFDWNVLADRVLEVYRGAPRAASAAG
jgi:glycosyltransferase involved in cell wall biosynthesis